MIPARCCSSTASCLARTKACAEVPAERQSSVEESLQATLHAAQALQNMLRQARTHKVCHVLCRTTGELIAEHGRDETSERGKLEPRAHRGFQVLDELGVHLRRVIVIDVVLVVVLWTSGNRGGPQKGPSRSSAIETRLRVLSS